jgi:hypothetical protein
VASINSVADEIARELHRYSHLVEEEVEVAKEEVAEELVTTLKASQNTKKTGRYNKGWRIKKQGNKLIVHNKTDYQLTHLLEKGHAKSGGGRVPAKVHIRPAEQRAITNYLEKVEQAIRQ